jgi:putative phage-type endonuclease
MPVVEGLEQQTPEWLQMRVGMVTASRMWCVMDKLKDPKKESAERRKYKKELVFECLTGRAADNYVSPAMEWGIETEPLAVAAYEMERDVTVQDGGFFIHDEIPRCGASPDGLVGDDGLIEIKCPTSATHIDTLISQTIPPEYEWQMLAEMACTGRQWCDFVSFDPRLPKHLRLFIKRFPRDEVRIKEMTDEVCRFLLECIALIKQLEAPHAE